MKRATLALLIAATAFAGCARDTTAPSTPVSPLTPATPRFVLSGTATTTNLVVTPTSTVFDANNVTGVSGDAAPGFPTGSLASDGTGKTDMYFTPESLFGGREVTVGDVAKISYWTKKAGTHTADPRDWFPVIYTKPYSGQLGGGWYGVRIGAEPYFSESVVDPANQWNQWTTAAGTNQLRFFESTYNYFGSYTDSHFADFIAGQSVAGSRGPGVPYATQPIEFFSVQTATAWANGFTGQLDGLRIELVDGSVANINFDDANHVASDKNACKKGGWATLMRSDFTPFSNQGDCVSYTQTGK